MLICWHYSSICFSVLFCQELLCESNLYKISSRACNKCSFTFSIRGLCIYGVIENKSWFDLILLVLQSLGPRVYLSHYTIYVIHWASLGAFLSDDVQVNMRMACSHEELWICPVGWKFTKPGAGLWWTSSLFCPLRCKVTSAHQRETPYRVHLMLLSPQTHTRTAHLHLRTHTQVSAYTLH